MRPSRMGGIRPYEYAALVVNAVLAGFGAGGCSGDVAPAGSGTTDGGGSSGSGSGSGSSSSGGGSGAGSGGGASSGGDAGHVCPGLGCFPQCPNGTLKDTFGCDTCQCAPAADAGGTGVCTTSADCANMEICGFLESAGCAATGQCFPAGPFCAVFTGVACSCQGADVNGGTGCAAGLPGGYAAQPLLHQGPCSDGGGACVSQRGGHCGGNIANPCTCASGLVCTAGDSGLPFGDVGGTCQ